MGVVNHSNKLSYEKGIKKDEFFKAQNKILKSYIQSEVEKEKTPSLSSIDDIMQESDYIPFSFFGHDTSASGAVYLIPNSVSEENNAIEKEMTRKPEIDSNKFSYFIGTLNGMFVISPLLRYGHDKINGLSPNKALIEYYKEVFSTEYVAQTGIALLSALAVPLVEVGLSYYGLNINIGSSVQAQSNEFLTPFWQGIIYSSLPDAIVLGNDIIQYSYNHLNDCF